MLRGLVRVFDRPVAVWTAGVAGIGAALVALIVIGGASLQTAERTALGESALAAVEAGAAKARDARGASGGPMAGGASGSGEVSVATGTGARGPAGGEMRVRVLAGMTGVQIASASGLLVSSGERGGAIGKSGAAITVVLDAVGWLVTETGAGGNAGDAGLRYPAGMALTATPVRAQDGVRLNGKLLPGRLRLSARSDMGLSTFDVIELVGIEDYLPGVVAKEMPGGWPLEAYKVQAVCARSYAVQERDRSLAKGQPFDVEAGEQDQAYLGVTDNAAAISAVLSTRGQVLTWQGRVLRAYYSSTCGGRPGAAQDTWPIGPGWEFNLDEPIQAAWREHICEDAPLYRWEVHRDRRELAARLRAFGEQKQMIVRQIRDIAEVEKIGVNAVGRPTRFKVIEPGGRWFTLSGEELRVACNTPVAGRAEVVDRRSRVSSSDIDVRVRGGEVVIVGRGFGHGVGMCQYCARGFAARGEDWQTMLRRFYPGASVEKRW